jgi:hypothetical protein
MAYAPARFHPKIPVSFALPAELAIVKRDPAPGTRTDAGPAAAAGSPRFRAKLAVP